MMDDNMAVTSNAWKIMAAKESAIESSQIEWLCLQCAHLARRVNNEQTKRLTDAILALERSIRDIKPFAEIGGFVKTLDQTNIELRGMWNTLGERPAPRLVFSDSVEKAIVWPVLSPQYRT